MDLRPPSSLSRRADLWQQIVSSWLGKTVSSLANWLGEISLPVYLLQAAAFDFVGRTLWAVPLTIGMAAAVHYTVEQPSRKWLRGITTQRREARHA